VGSGAGGGGSLTGAGLGTGGLGRIGSGEGLIGFHSSCKLGTRLHQSAYCTECNVAVDKSARFVQFLQTKELRLECRAKPKGQALMPQNGTRNSVLAFAIVQQQEGKTIDFTQFYIFKLFSTY
jgi:hypothetical protein